MNRSAIRVRDSQPSTRSRCLTRRLRRMAVLSPTIDTMQNILTVNLTVKLKWCREKPSVFKSLQVLSGSEFSLSGSINTLWDLNEMEAFGSAQNLKVALTATCH